MALLILQQSDRHPPGILNGADLATFDPAVVRDFLLTGVLVQTESLSATDEAVLLQLGDELVSVSPEDGECIGGQDPRSCEVYEIAIDKLCARFRRSGALQGPPVRQLSASLFFLGMGQEGVRRREFYLATGLRGERAIQTLAFARLHTAPGNRIVILTPTRRDLPNAFMKHLEHERAAVLAASELLASGSVEPFTISLASATGHATDPSTARLLIDQGGWRATFDGTELGLSRREFAVLSALAIEASDNDGYVSSGDILDIIEAESSRQEPPQLEQVAQVITALRKKFEAATSSEEDGGALITNKRSVGYRLNVSADSIGIS